MDSLGGVLIAVATVFIDPYGMTDKRAATATAIGIATATATAMQLQLQARMAEGIFHGALLVWGLG
jgi:hypothetical protein